MKAGTLSAAFEHVDKADHRIGSAMRAAEMITAIAHVCSDADSAPDREDLQSILRGLIDVGERLTRDLAEADEALSAGWQIVRSAESEAEGA